MSHVSNLLRAAVCDSESGYRALHVREKKLGRPKGKQRGYLICISFFAVWAGPGPGPAGPGPGPGPVRPTAASLAQAAAWLKL